MVRCIAAALFSVFSLLAVFACAESGIAVVTPLNTYSEEDILKKAEEYCKEYGMLPAEVKADTEIWKRLVDDVIREYVYADLSLIHAGEIKAEGDPPVSEEEIRSKYENLLFSQKQYFADKKEVVTGAVLYPRDPIVYYPRGLKWVKTFTVPFEAAVRGQAAIFLSEEKLDDYDRLVNAAENDMAPLLNELRQKLKGNFDEVAAEYGGDDAEELLYDEDFELFFAQLAALKTLKEIGDIAEYNVYQGHAFMILVRRPDYIEVPYEIARGDIEASIKNAKTILQHDKQMKKLYAEAVAKGSVKVRMKETLGG
ncbi:MAG: hypothetical protein LBQ44_03810 [Treponema sp.]|jgi:hypothetical protein|nr:hypothetical protein [Treponema sp.]